MNNKVQRHDLIILEEASMVNRSTFVDLASHGIQIIAVGDHAQLGPIEENNNAPPFNLMLNPDVRLEKILRQAETNPIITIATMVRNGDKIPYGYFGDKVLKTGDVRRTRRHPYGDINSILLCNRNETRIKYINQAREILGYENAGPEVGELIICLRNNMDEGINNGDIGVILETYENSEDTYYVKADMGYGIFSGLTDKEQWYRLYSGGTLEGIERFTWSYASTVHKAQGSEWSRVLVIEERCKGQSDDDWRRWLYTAVSRAKERLEIIG
jgi:ATP-dependent exoDNAse (exonuclease V) alpha subunit